MGKEPACKSGDGGDVGSVLLLGRSHGGGHGNLLQYSCLENPRDRGAWWATVHRVVKTQTRPKRLSTHTHNQGSCKICAGLLQAAAHCESPAGRLFPKLNGHGKCFCVSGGFFRICFGRYITSCATLRSYLI